MMPILEGVCHNSQCSLAGRRQEHYYHHYPKWAEGEALNACDQCGSPTVMVGSPFRIVWTGPISQRYREKTADGYHAPDGMDVWTRRSTGGKPELRHLETWQDVRSYAKSEGCYDPREIPKTVESFGDSCSSRGFSGQEV